MGEEIYIEKLNDFSPTPENMALLPCIQSQAFILGCYVCLDPGSFCLISVFKDLFPDVFHTRA